MEEISFSTIIDMPQCKFINEEVIVVNIKCGTYDEVLKEDNFDLIGRYFHTDFYNIDNSGIELHLQSAIGCRVIVNNKGEWQELRREIEDNPKIKEFEIIDVIRIGHIPFYEIVDVDLEGDYLGEKPVLYCRFEIDEWPYDEYRYKPIGDHIFKRYTTINGYMDKSKMRTLV